MSTSKLCVSIDVHLFIYLFLGASLCVSEVERACKNFVKQTPSKKRREDDAESRIYLVLLDCME